jgi:hypothetical protein
VDAQRIGVEIQRMALGQAEGGQAVDARRPARSGQARPQQWQGGVQPLEHDPFVALQVVGPLIDRRRLEVRPVEGLGNFGDGTFEDLARRRAEQAFADGPGTRDGAEAGRTPGIDWIEDRGLS